MVDETAGPFIVWVDYGCEGWQPSSYLTLKEAVESRSYQSTRIITKLVEYDIIVKETA